MTPKTKKNSIKIGLILSTYAFSMGFICTMLSMVAYGGWSRTPNWPLWVTISGLLGCVVFVLMGGALRVSTQEPEEPKLLKVTETYGQDDDEDEVTVTQEL